MSVNTLQIFEKLGVAPAALFITAVSVDAWQQRVSVSFLYDGSYKGEKLQVFSLIFENCQSINYEFIPGRIDETSASGIADVIGVLIDFDHHQQPANIQTDCFGLSIAYQSFILEHVAVIG